MYFQRDHFAPHKSRKFEGYYTRTQLEDGGTVAIIFCWIKHAKQRSNYVHVSYTPSGSGPAQYLQRPPTPADTLSSRSHTLKAVPSAESMSPSLGRTSRSSFSPAPLAAFKYNFFPEKIDVVTSKPARRGGHVPFTITAPGIGHMAVTADSIEYSIIVPEKHLRVHLVLDAHTPWSASPLAGPMGGIMHLSWLLPLNWHVRSTRSRATYALEHGRGLTASKAYGEGRAHVEKNWGGSFPRGWIWAQAFSDASSSDTSGGGDPWGLNGEFGKGHDRRDRRSQDRDTEGDREPTFCVAGGKAFPGVQAYLVGYRSRECQWDFRPPYAVALGRLSPFLHVRHDSRQGEVELSVSSWRRKLDVTMEAPPDTFMEMAAPLRGGHEPGFAHESFRAKVRVTASKRGWPGGRWRVVEEYVLGQVGAVQCGALEFGGSFYHKVDASA
ncbi:hypothetical protein C8T65DRAFT_97084 [Cerioporus squamosus]|nr:hypothetical protein C8T65DRAFT_97084 [Cerioporus squamosus]